MHSKGASSWATLHRSIELFTTHQAQTLDPPFAESVPRLHHFLRRVIEWNKRHMHLQRESSPSRAGERRLVIEEHSSLLSDERVKPIRGDIDRWNSNKNPSLQSQLVFVSISIINIEWQIGPTKIR